ncbi:S9 family peptidase [Mesorhizobium sp. AR02]|nr:S9 family peptidase [Mesorhizobium sp. AR02]
MGLVSVPAGHVLGAERMPPPLPRVEPRIRILHDDVTIDQYGWLRDRTNPDVRAYLEAENSYADQVTAHLTDLKAELVAEIEGRRPCEGAPPAFQVGPFEYFQRPEPGLLHSRWWRRPLGADSAELVVDPNALEGAEVFYRLGVFEPSDDGRYVAFSFDVIGAENYELRVRDMETGRDVWQGSRQAVTAAWAADGYTLFFTRERPDLRRQCHELIRLDVAAGSSEVVFEEADERLNVGIRRSDSGAWLFLDVKGVRRGPVEVWCLPADKLGVGWRRLVTRELGHQVFAEHWQDKFLFHVDDTGPYWRLVRTPIDDPSPSGWEEVVPHRDGVMLEEVHVLEHQLVLLERVGLRPRLVSRDESGRIGATIVPDEPSCSLTVGLSAGGHYSVARHPFRGSRLMYRISSFVTPDLIIEHNLTEGTSAVRYQASIPGFDAAQYVATVVMVEAEDGVQVPVSLVARRDRTSPGPVLLNVYGCYGVTRWPSFFAWPSYMTERLSLLDRGVAFGIVHARGGGELGYPWHEAATGDRKRTTFTDLIAAAEGLVEQGFATLDGIVIDGKSGGGGVVLATAALRPDLFCAVLAEVPLADILDTELDFTMPYARVETAEYGDPHIVHEYRYLRSYDPYYNLSADRPLPPTYVDAALNDGQVLYYQPARYVAQRRFCAADHDPNLVFRMRTVGGHSSGSHGPSVAEEAAFRMAWVLDHLRRPSS